MRRRHHFGAGAAEEFRLYTATTDYGVGAAPAARPVARPATVTGQAAGLINMAAQPVRWGFRQAAGLAHFLGNTLSGIGNKL